MKSSRYFGNAGRILIWMVVTFIFIVVTVFITNHWIKMNLDTNQTAVSQKSNVSATTSISPAGPTAGLLSPEETHSESAALKTNPPQKERKIVFETPLKDTILVQ